MSRGGKGMEKLMETEATDGHVVAWGYGSRFGIRPPGLILRFENTTFDLHV